MGGELLKYFSVYLLSTIKFIGGPLAGISTGLSFLETFGLTVAGMMSSVVVFSLLGNTAHRYYVRRRRAKNKPIFSKKTRRVVKVWRRFGMPGIAFLTPLILTPIGGTVLATVFGVAKTRIMGHMLWSALFWGFALTLIVFQLKHLPFLEFLK
ncbi:hypothetical protein [Rufibacter roseus]|uniref:Small multi-drug export protein n=1 Tax=Rufibacter roseus TaxID=1567108 RepID=A0ABW2DEX5_9BACT|nr:hypothetical protein [Rufibacter roseus]